MEGCIEDLRKEERILDEEDGSADRGERDEGRERERAGSESRE